MRLERELAESLTKECSLEAKLSAADAELNVARADKAVCEKRLQEQVGALFSVAGIASICRAECLCVQCRTNPLVVCILTLLHSSTNPDIRPE